MPVIIEFSRCIGTYSSAKFELFIKLARIQFVIQTLLVFGLIFVGRPFISMWAGEGYGDAYWIILLLVIPEIVPLTQNLGIEIQRAKNKHQFRAVLYSIIAVINLAISIPLGKAWGGIGCAIGTAFGQIIGNTLIMNWYYEKKLNIDIRQYWKNIIQFVPSLILPFIVGIILIRINIQGITGFVGGVLAVSVSYVVSMWKWGLNQSEKDQVLRFARYRR